MVNLKKRTIGKKKYYYLQHSFRKDGKIQKKEIYLGRQLPENFEEIKRKFISERYEKKWFESFDEIKKNYCAEQRHMPKSAKEKAIESFATRFTYDTNRIEGSRLTLKETADLLEKGVSPKKPIADIKEAEAHKKIFYEMLSYQNDLSLQIILYWHKKLFESTKPDIAGITRKYQVEISRSKFTPPFPAEIFPLLREFFKWYEKNKGKMYPVELAALVHLKFVTIHPFGDGNGRISRLMMNFILHRKGFPLIIIPYEKRAGYYNALERSQIKRDERIFMQWFFNRYLKSFRKYLNK